MLRGYIYNSWEPPCLALVFISFFVQSAHSLVGESGVRRTRRRKKAGRPAELVRGGIWPAPSSEPVKDLDHHRQAARGAEFAAWADHATGFAVIGALIISRLWERAARTERPQRDSRRLLLRGRANSLHRPPCPEAETIAALVGALEHYLRDELRR